MNYLIDTNVFFDILMQIADPSKTSELLGWDDAKKGKCYISHVTQIEIVSVIGKYARGRNMNWQSCQRQIQTSDGTVGVCHHRWRSVEGTGKTWPTKKIRAVRKLVQDILSSDSPVWKVEILPVDQEVWQESSNFIEKAMKYSFGSLDAIIAGTAKRYDDLLLRVVTKDKGFRVALQADGVPLLQ